MCTYKYHHHHCVFPTKDVKKVTKLHNIYYRIEVTTMSDSSYSAATRHRQPYSTAGRLPTLEIVDDEWAADTLSDDDLNCDIHEAAIASFLEEGDLDVDTVVVSAIGHSDPSSNGLSERRKREEGRWNDMGLDNFNTSSGNNNNNSSSLRRQNHTTGDGGNGPGAEGAAAAASGESSTQMSP